jgi:hypothetical protein
VTDEKTKEGKVLLGHWSVPPADATDEEIDAWAEAVVGEMQAAAQEPDPEPEAPSPEAS